MLDDFAFGPEFVFVANEVRQNYSIIWGRNGIVYIVTIGNFVSKLPWANNNNLSFSGIEHQNFLRHPSFDVNVLSKFLI